MLMLDLMRQNSRSTVIYVLFGLVIAMFIINFGPQSGTSCSGPTAAQAGTVNGYALTEADFQHAYMLMGFANAPANFAKERRLREYVMDKLIERELLAQEAERLGIRVTDHEIEDMIVQGRYLVLGMRRNIGEIIFKNGAYDHEYFTKNFVQYRLGSTVKKVIDEQKRELLAERVKDLLRAGITVSPDEVKEEYLSKETQVNLQFVRFLPKAQEGEVPAADVEKFLAANKDKVKEHYTQREFYYKNMPKELKLRQILLKDEAAAQALAKELAAKPEDFAKQATGKSEDPTAKDNGGLVGWRRKGALGLEGGDDALFGTAVGKVAGPFKSKRGNLIFKVEDLREGNVPLEKVERELAEELAKRDRSFGKARKDADAYLAKIKGGEKMEALFPKQKSSDDGDDQAKPKGTPSYAPEAPTLQETGMFTRRGDVVPEVGLAKELAKKAFKLKLGEVAGPFDTTGAIVIVSLKERKDAKIEEFEKKKAEVVADFQASRWAEVVDEWSKRRCVEARDAGHIRVNQAVLAYERTGPEEAKSSYQPCGSGGQPFGLGM
jgi:peptidyl-prolyl cis-trans isomerase D